MPKIDQIIQSKVYEDTDVMDDDVEDIQAIAVMMMIVVVIMIIIMIVVVMMMIMQ